MINIMYHYVRNYNKSYPYFKYLKKKTFLNQIKKFEKKNGIISNKFEIDTCPNKFLLTFDDGTKDHFEVAKILKKRGHTGIFFISTMPYIKKRLLDVHLIQLISSKMKSKDLLNELSLILKKKKINYIFNKFVKKNKKKEIYNRDDNNIRYFKSFLNYETDKKVRKIIINHFVKKFKINIKVKDFYLTKNEIIKMKKMGMIIGSHGYSHEILSKLSFNQQKNEIIGSKKYLEKIINSKVDFFCYPYGKSFTYNRKTLNVLRKSEYKYSFTGNNGILKKTSKKTLKSKMYLLPRIDTNNIII